MPGEEVRSSPLVRKLASEHNVDLRQVTGSGAGGRVTKDDILAFVERAKTAPDRLQRRGRNDCRGSGYRSGSQEILRARRAWWSRCR